MEPKPSYEQLLAENLELLGQVRVLTVQTGYCNEQLQSIRRANQVMANKLRGSVALSKKLQMELDKSLQLQALMTQNFQAVPDTAMQMEFNGSFLSD